MTTPKRHYANKAARDFLRGTAFTSPQEAIEAGARTEFQWQTFMLGQAAKFWRENGRKAREKVKRRHPIKRVRRKRGELPPEMGQNCPQTEVFGNRKLRKDVLALEKQAQEWANIGGVGRIGLDRSAVAAHGLWLDFTRHAVAGDFPAWLSRLSGVPLETCRRRLKAGCALAVGINPRMNHGDLIETLRDREVAAG